MAKEPDILKKARLLSKKLKAQKSGTRHKSEVSGRDAIRLAEKTGAQLRAHADPTGASDRPITMRKALELAEEDPSLVYVQVRPRK